MQIVVCLNAGERIVSLEVAQDCLTKELKRKCESLWGMPHNKMEIYHEGESLGDLQTLKECYIEEGDFLCVLTPDEDDDSTSINSHDKRPELLLLPFTYPISMTSIAVEHFNLNNQGPLSVDPELLKTSMDMLRKSNYELSSALEEGDLATYFRVLGEQMDHQTNLYRQLCRGQNAAGKQSNIQVDRVTGNADNQINMLTIACKVNGVLIKAAIDTCSQATIMSEKFAEHCNLKDLIDKRCSTVALQIGETLILVKVTVVKQLALNMLIGLDVLRYHNCIIDFKRNIVTIGNTETEFVNENVAGDHNELTNA